VDDLDRRPGESWDEYITRLDRPDTEELDAAQRRRLREALAQARADRMRERLRQWDTEDEHPWPPPGDAG
jgi:hypothetical protein